MSLGIDVDRVTHVLLADGWHRCDWQQDEQSRQRRLVSTLTFDAYEYLWYHDPSDRWSPTLIASGIEGLVPYTGFSFIEDGSPVLGPLTSILAVKTGNKPAQRAPASEADR